MEQLFNDLKKEGKNDVDSLVKWMKDANILGNAKESEEKVRGLLKESKDQANVDFAKFKQIVEQLATDQKKNFEDISKTLTARGPEVLKQLKEGAGTAKGMASDAAATAQNVVKDAANAAAKMFGKK